jgi:hypothetical protein
MKGTITAKKGGWRFPDGRIQSPVLWNLKNTTKENYTIILLIILFWGVQEKGNRPTPFLITFLTDHENTALCSYYLPPGIVKLEAVQCLNLIHKWRKKLAIF